MKEELKIPDSIMSLVEENRELKRRLTKILPSLLI